MELNFTGTDICAINGTRSAPEAHYNTVVVGAGASRQPDIGEDRLD
jgi:hypothetical protein